MTTTSPSIIASRIAHRIDYDKRLSPLDPCAETSENEAGCPDVGICYGFVGVVIGAPLAFAINVTHNWRITGANDDNQKRSEFDRGIRTRRASTARLRHRSY